MTNKMTIGKKLYTSFGAVLMLTLGVGFIGINGIDNISTASDKLIKVYVAKRGLANNVKFQMASILASERGIMVRAYMKDKPTMLQYNQDFGTQSAAIQK